MRWFKHLTTANHNQKLMRLRDEFGIEGYGAYWLILELIAEPLDAKNETFFELSTKNLRHFLGFSTKKLKNFLSFSENVELFSFSFVDNSENLICLSCPNLLKYRDEWTRRKRKTPESHQSNSGVTPEQETEYRDRVQSIETEKALSNPTGSSSTAEAVDHPPPNICPYQKIVDVYHEMLPHAPVIRILTTTRKAQLKARWNNELPKLEHWRMYFERVADSDFLCGRVQSPGKRPFVANLDWLLKPSNYAKIIERRYMND